MLSQDIIEGLYLVISDAEAMLEERQGWREESLRDAPEERALAYLRELVQGASDT